MPATMAHSITLKASFLEPYGSAVARATQTVADIGQSVPFVGEGVLMKKRVTVGTDFEVACLVDKDEVVINRGAVPIPDAYQEQLQKDLKKSRRATSLISQEADLLKEVASKLHFVADIWWRVKVNRTGFVEYQIHVGQEGLGVQKWVGSSQFWVALTD